VIYEKEINKRQETFDRRISGSTPTTAQKEEVTG